MKRGLALDAMGWSWDQVLFERCIAFVTIIA